MLSLVRWWMAVSGCHLNTHTVSPESDHLVLHDNPHWLPSFLNTRFASQAFYPIREIVIKGKIFTSQVQKYKYKTWKDFFTFFAIFCKGWWISKTKTRKKSRFGCNTLNSQSDGVRNKEHHKVRPIKPSSPNKMKEEWFYNWPSERLLGSDVSECLLCGQWDSEDRALSLTDCHTPPQAQH